MTQRQLNMILAIENGISDALNDLQGPGSNLAIQKAMADLSSDKPRSMGLAATAYYAAMYMAWKERGFPGPVVKFPDFK